MTDDPAARLQVDTSEESGWLVLRLVGDLDPHTAPLLEETIDEHLGSGALAIDLEKIGFMDSAGLRVLISAQERATERAVELALRSPSDSARRVLEITGLTDHLRIDPS
ncbi:MAG: STAS domain-containing protein [Acidimicrobiia bacterium]|nr:STAS domain-containing protein [Acidimicrobiia bacterium]